MTTLNDVIEEEVINVEEEKTGIEGDFYDNGVQEINPPENQKNDPKSPSFHFVPLRPWLF